MDREVGRRREGYTSRLCSAFQFEERGDSDNAPVNALHVGVRSRVLQRRLGRPGPQAQPRVGVRLRRRRVGRVRQRHLGRCGPRPHRGRHGRHSGTKPRGRYAGRRRGGPGRVLSGASGCRSTSKSIPVCGVSASTLASSSRRTPGQQRSRCASCPTERTAFGSSADVRVGGSPRRRRPSR